MSVFLKGNAAEWRETHWLGGPNLALEIVSPGDRTREKFDFYASVGTQELVVLERQPWRLELYRLQDGQLQPHGVAHPGDAGLETATVPTLWSMPDVDAPWQLRLEHADRAEQYDESSL